MVTLERFWFGNYVHDKLIVHEDFAVRINAYDVRRAFVVDFVIEVVFPAVRTVIVATFESSRALK